MHISSYHWLISPPNNPNSCFPTTHRHMLSSVFLVLFFFCFRLAIFFLVFFFNPFLLDVQTVELIIFIRSSTLTSSCTLSFLILSFRVTALTALRYLHCLQFPFLFFLEGPILTSKSESMFEDCVVYCHFCLC